MPASLPAVRRPAIREAPLHRRGYREARPGDVVGLELTIVDVRPSEELLGPDGHIHGVWQAPLSGVMSHGLPDFDPSAPVVVVCGNGRDSGDVAEVLVQRWGFTEVYLLVGGMVRWNAESRPTARIPTQRTVTLPCT